MATEPDSRARLDLFPGAGLVPFAAHAPESQG